MNKNNPLRIFAVSIILTLALAATMFWYDGFNALWLFVVLAVLEVTFSFDNAVVNSRILARMSPFWQMLFLTVGIFIAVFVVRFILPIVIVMLPTGLGFMDVVQLAFNNPVEYGAKLSEAGPLIEAFGGTFLLMIGVNYFLDHEKDVHWIRPLEKKLAPAGQFENLKVLIMLVIAAVLYFTVGTELQSAVLAASVLGIILHVGLELLGQIFAQDEPKAGKKVKQQVGMAAFASFMYLEVLDASFSFDGVIGAFAITTSVVLIVAGLGVGALWVRSLTVYLMRAGTLAKYRYLEHGAHWAILALGLVMLVKLYHIELPEWFTGSIGLVFIATAVLSSVLEKRRQDSLAK
jgi:uncharacterized protein